MHPRDYEEHPNEMHRWPSILVSEKHNGVRAVVSPNGGSEVYSKHYRRWWHLDQRFHNPCAYWLDGEIMWPGHCLQDIAGLLAGEEADAKSLSQLEFRAFDIIAPKLTFEQRYELLFTQEYSFNIHPVAATVVEYVPLPDKFDWSTYAPDYEGNIYRNPKGLYLPGKSHDVLKHKRMHSAEGVCLSVKEGLGKFKGMFGGAELQLDSGVTFSCGGGDLTVKDRQKLWANPPIGKRITFRYPYASKDGVPLQAQFEAVRDYE